MYRELLHICGPISINSFGLCISIGFVLFMRLLFRNTTRKELINDQQLNTLLFSGVLAALVGSRLLYFSQNWHSLHSWTDFLAIADGGLSIMGGILSCLVLILVFSIVNQIPTLQLFDILVLYAPMIQAFGRLGCFCAGCCHGIVCTSWHAITYTDPKSFAPLYTPLHPTQLYSALSFFALFVILQFIARQKPAPGILLSTYLLLSSTERFIVDFWRADREFITRDYFTLFSLHQWIALLFIISSLVLLRIVSRPQQSTVISHEPI